MQARQRTDSVLIAIFLVAISVPLLAQLAGSASGTEQSEKRQLAKLPAFPTSLTALLKLPDSFGSYYKDHFGLRAKLIRLHALVTYKLSGLSPSDQVLVGRENWLYYAADSSLEDYRSLQPFTKAELERWQQVMEERQAWLARHGAKLLIVLACDKYVIYPEYLPDGYHRQPGPYRIDELAEYLKKNSSLNVVTLHPALESGKGSDRLYHRTDTHWNDRGAFIGYREIVNALGMQPADFKQVAATTPGWDLARMMGLDDVIHEENLALEPLAPRRAKVIDRDRPDEFWNNGHVILEVANPNLPRLVMFRDSFGSALVPFLAEHFRRSVFLWQYDFDPKWIEKEHPDVVIWLMTSRRLQWYKPENPRLD